MSNISLKNFKVLQISLSKDNDNYKCFLCEIYTSRVAIFSDCNHFCCNICLDNLYDTYNNYNNNKSYNDKSYNNELFICTLCNQKVYDIRYSS